MAEQIQHFGNRFGYFHGQKTRRNLLPVKIADNRQVGGGVYMETLYCFLGARFGMVLQFIFPRQWHPVACDVRGTQSRG